ncbi:hypothetical protein Cantr_06510 [Candida viswanathii]|uniref:Zn(2)-C6 fungal-type domain-containing protein n=1 Tax=Candida viswanathii TaxID=5486 RepID=A0A367XWH1_9ASCO|nr:hypothetical protein Cantr_06510 [Candida viswanathii]
MSVELLPISCVSCRRRKIKCNKKKPCDQCVKRQLICEFPATFRNIKILENEFKAEPQNDLNLLPDAPLKIAEDSTTTPTSGSGSILSSGQNKSSSEATESRPLSSDNNSNAESLSPDKIPVILNNDTESRSDSSTSTANPLRLFPFDHHQQHPHVRPKFDTLQYLDLQEKYELMRAANSQLLADNRNLSGRVKDLLNTSLMSSDGGKNSPQPASGGAGGAVSGSKRDRDYFSDDFPNKRERVGVFGHTKASFPKDSASDNLGMYSTNRPPEEEQEEANQEAGDDGDEEDNNNATAKENSSASAASISSGDETGQQLAPEFIPRDERILPPPRKQVKANKNKHQHQHHHHHDHQQQHELQHRYQIQRQLQHQGPDGRTTNDWERDIASFQDQELVKSNILVENSFKKKDLPILPSYLLKYDDPELNPDSDTYSDVFKLNFKVIIKLVQWFFENSPYYRTFIPCGQVFEFLKKYESISDRDWNNDDDLLLVYMILCLSIQRLSPKDYVDLDLLPDASVNTCTKYRKYLTRHVIYRRFERLRDNLVHESLQTIRAHILCVEWLFADQKYEDCWSMMFHACSVSYSIGLHIMGEYKSPGSKPNKELVAASTTEDSDGSYKRSPELYEGDVNIDNDTNTEVSRFRLWHALKYYTSIICAIFGRPNPISVQVGMNSSNTGVMIPNKKLHILLKIGSGELLRLSNMMLIENYMINVTFDDLMKLAAKFTKEIELLEKAYKWFDDSSDETALDLSSSPSEREGSSSSFISRLNYDEFTKHPLAPTQLDVLSDTIILYVNYAKLFEPFIKKLEKHKNYDMIISNQIKSVTKFLELSTLFVDKFIKNYVELHLHRATAAGNASSDEEHNKSANKPYFPRPLTTNYGPVKLGRLFKAYYPFLNSLICQGIIVVFTLLHSKSKEFAKNDEKSLLNNSFLKIVEDNMNKFLGFESTMSTKFITTSRMWSSNMVYIVNRVLNLIKLIHEKQKQKTTPLKEDQEYLKQKTQISTIIHQEQHDFPITTSKGNLSYLLNPNPFGDPSLFEYLNGFHLNDPYWLTVPDNLPYYLGSQIEMDQFKNQQKPSDTYPQE